MLRTIILTVSLAALLLAGCRGGLKLEPDWVQITSSEGNFSAWFPSQPEHKALADQVHQYVVSKNDSAFIIRYTPRAETSVTYEDRFDRTVKSMKPTSMTMFDVTIDGYAGKEMTIHYFDEGKDWISRARMFYANGNLYQFIVVTTKVHGFPEEEARRFYSGFQLLSH